MRPMDNCTDMSFIPARAPRQSENSTIQLWAIIINGEIVGYTDEPETLADGKPRIDGRFDAGERS